MDFWTQRDVSFLKGSVSHLTESPVAGSQENHGVFVHVVHGDRRQARVLDQRNGPQGPPQSQRVLEMGRATVQLLGLQLEERGREKRVGGNQRFPSASVRRHKVEIRKWRRTKTRLHMMKATRGTRADSGYHNSFVHITFWEYLREHLKRAGRGPQHS